MGFFRYLLFAAAGLLAYLLFKRFVAGSMRQHAEKKEDERLERLVQDPECKVYVDSRDAVRRKVPDGELYFCSEKCAKEYMARYEGG